MSGDEYKALEDQENEPLRNRATKGTLPAGINFQRRSLLLLRLIRVR